MTQKRSTCATCVFFVKPEAWRGDEAECRADPPRILAEVGIRRLGCPEKGHLFGAWPIVQAVDWCGRWRDENGETIFS